MPGRIFYLIFAIAFLEMHFIGIAADHLPYILNALLVCTLVVTTTDEHDMKLASGFMLASFRIPCGWMLMDKAFWKRWHNG